MHPTPSAWPHGLVGQSQQVAAIRRLIEKAAQSPLSVLLLGESGTGKEVVARAIHNANPRGQFVPIDCGSLVGTLMESELFGHTKGAFSGATENKRGLVELADGGTAFDDEIGDLPLDMQVKLLRLIQEREFRAVGSLQWRKVDIRIIAATHRNLQDEVAAGRFRLDLYYRLNVFALRLPPLRQRKEDIPLLVYHFLSLGQAAGIQGIEPSQELLDTFEAYDWPGNVRELKHCIDRLTALRSEGALEMGDLPSALLNHRAMADLQSLSGALAHAAAVGGNLPDFAMAPKSPVIPVPESPVISLPESERHAIASALKATGGERGKTARLLGIGRTTLYRKMKQYGIE
jgi:DNA-binding NtrC family response regulator